MKRWARSHGKTRGLVLGIDLQEIEPIAEGPELPPKTRIFLEDDAEPPRARVKAWLRRSPAEWSCRTWLRPYSGHKQTESPEDRGPLARRAAQFAFDVLEEGRAPIERRSGQGGEALIQDAAQAPVPKRGENVNPPAWVDSSGKFVVARGLSRADKPEDDPDTGVPAWRRREPSRVGSTSGVESARCPGRRRTAV